MTRSGTGALLTTAGGAGDGGAAAVAGTGVAVRPGAADDKADPALGARRSTAIGAAVFATGGGVALVGLAVGRGCATGAGVIRAEELATAGGEAGLGLGPDVVRKGAVSTVAARTGTG